MATTITISDIKDGFTTSLSDDQINLAIAVVDQANTCLDANSVSSDIQKALKIYGARHILSMQANSGRGEVTSESAPSGASRSFASRKVDSSPFYSLLKQLDKYGCVIGQLENEARISIRSVGRKRSNTEIPDTDT